MGWSRPLGGHCGVTARSESGGIDSPIHVLVLENFGDLWEEKQFPLDLGSLWVWHSQNLLWQEENSKAGVFLFGCAQAGLGFSRQEFPAELFPFPKFPIQQNIS